MISLSDIQAAMARTRGFVFHSPCAYSETFSRLTANSVYLKLENLQMTGSFKERGALNKILTLTSREAERGLIAASAGNHGQAVAYHAGKRGLKSQIWMPITTPLTKVSSTRGYGAEVVLEGANYDEAYTGAVGRGREENLTFIHPFDDEMVIAGQGTIGLELLEDHPELEAVVVPVGGGGLIAGVACAVKERRPAIRVIGVQTSRLPSMKVAVSENQLVVLPASTTLADGIAVRSAGAVTMPLVRRYVDEIVTVEEEEIANAILLLLEREKTLVEGAGAVGVAALLNRKTSLSGKRTAVVVGGGNIDVTILSRIIERGLVKDGRMLRLRIHLPDHPGSLHRLTDVISRHRANIVQTSYDRAYYGVNMGDAVIEINFETRGPEHIDELISALSAAGYTHERVL
jgi:threonine dehydratase